MLFHQTLIFDVRDRAIDYSGTRARLSFDENRQRIRQSYVVMTCCNRHTTDIIPSRIVSKHLQAARTSLKAEYLHSRIITISCKTFSPVIRKFKYINPIFNLQTSTMSNNNQDLLDIAAKAEQDLNSDRAKTGSEGRKGASTSSM